MKKCIKPALTLLLFSNSTKFTKVNKPEINQKHPNRKSKHGRKKVKLSKLNERKQAISKITDFY